jgi:CubicO group peptidase (beta-lactamase class C family)
VIALPPQPSDVRWPTDRWERHPLPNGADAERLNSMLDAAVSVDGALARTLGVVIVHRGVLVAERYHATSGPDDALISWSMAKSVVHAACGVAVGRGLLDTTAPAGLPAWQRDLGDPRAAITVDQLLRMTSGLRWVEDYVDGAVSTVIEMLFGAGIDDHAAYAAAFDLEAPPGTTWRYSSGTSNIVARIVQDAVGGSTERMQAFLDESIFGPLGMTSADPRFDTAGTFVGSSYLYATAQDFARFGLLYLRDGVWDGRRLLPAGWVDRARTVTPQSHVDEVHDYGEHWWVWRGDIASYGAFGAHGYEGQYTLVVPGLDLVVVRLGKSPAETHDALRAWMRSLVGCFDPA